MQEIKPSKPLFSAYYIASLISFFVFQLQFIENIITTIAGWLISFLAYFTGANLRGNGPLWASLFFTCLFFTFLIKKYIVVPLGFYIKEESAKSWEDWALGFIVLGFYIYLLNIIFSQPMPLWPVWFVRLLGGYRNTYLEDYTRTIEEQNVWSILPWLWHLGPIAFMYVRTILYKKSSDG